MIRKLLGALAGLGLTGTTMLHNGGCEAEEYLPFDDATPANYTYYDSGYGAYGNSGTVDPLGIDIDLPYFDEGDYFEVPAYL